MAVPDFAYAPALESATAVAVRDAYELFIGGEWVTAAGEATYPTHNPATDERLASVACAQAADVDRAVRAARRGYDKYWRKLRPAERAKYVYRIARALEERSRELAVLEALDAGTPVRAARDAGLPHAAAQFFYHAGWADKLRWAIPATERVRPLGVAGAILSWHLPLQTAAAKIAPALACGNTVVLKPAEATPLAALHLARLCAEVDLPPGVLNVVTGNALTGAALAEHPDLDGLTFTGTAETGRSIRRAAAGTSRRLTLALDATPAIVLYDDAPLDQAVEGIVAALYLNAGQAVSPGARLFVQESIAAETVARLRERLATIRHGDPLDANTDLGPVASRSARDRVLDLVRGATADGAELFQGPWTPPESGTWFAASLLAGVVPKSRAAREAFGLPLVAVLTFRTPAEAIERANDVAGGVSAGVWTADAALAAYTAQRLTAGVVWCNTFNRLDAASPAGGYGEAGFGRFGGRAGLRSFLQS